MPPTTDDRPTAPEAPPVAVRAWHAVPAAEALQALGSGPAGLSQAEAARRLLEDGPNALVAAAGRPAWALFADQFRSPLIAILGLAAAVAWFLGKGFDVWVILAVVLLNAVLGFVLEYHASGAIAALQRLTSPRARVLRDGAVRELAAAEVVVGDVLVLEAGDRVAADARVLQANELAADESGLTGESLPVGKTAEPVGPGANVPLGDRTSLVFMQTPIVTGRGRAVVVATGMATEIGRIAEEVAEADNVPPVQRRLARFGGVLGATICGIVAAVMAIGLVLGRPPAEMVYVAISLAVAAIPEGLPLVVSALFAIGVTRMARRHALIRRLPAVEALGAATYVCTDKTGTLTRNAMTAVRVWHAGRAYAVEGAGYAPEGAVSPDPADAPGLAWLARCARLANDATVECDGGEWRVLGDPTEGALRVLAAKLPADDGGPDAWPRLEEIPFASERKWMATLHRSPDGELVAFVKGAEERLLAMACGWVDETGAVRPLDESTREALADVARAMADDALRVLALGMVRGVEGRDALGVDRLDGQVALLGLVGLIDPPRPAAREAVATCQAAGVRVVMITGDHAATAKAIARDLGILAADGLVVEGAELEDMPKEKLDWVVQRAAVFARVDPSHKLRIVRALQRRGEVVAMTGDGVNDAPALAQADIGIAMGVAGTEVAKGAAGMVLADDDFATIVAAIEEGRTIGDNLRKVIGYLMATCVANIATIAGAIVTGLPLPLTAVMLLWINLVAIGVFDRTLALEPAEPGTMRRAPRPPDEPLISREALAMILVWGLFMAAGTLAAFTWELGRAGTEAHARTHAFTVLSAFTWASAFVYRSADRSLFRLPPNPWMFLSLALAVGLHLLAVYAPPFQALLGTVALPPAHVAGAIAVGVSLIAASELAKLKS